MAARDARMVVRHTFLEYVEDDEMNACHAQGARFRSSSEPRKFGGRKTDIETPFVWADCECEQEWESSASTRATDTDDDTQMASDEEKPKAPVQAPPGVWAQPIAAGAQFVPVCIAFVPLVQLPVFQKSSRSARRRRARATNRWFRQQEGALEDGAEFDDDWQMPESDDVAESPEVDAESWPMPKLPFEIQDKKAMKA